MLNLVVHIVTGSHYSLLNNKHEKLQQNSSIWRHINLKRHQWSVLTQAANLTSKRRRSTSQPGEHRKPRPSITKVAGSILDSDAADSGGSPQGLSANDRIVVYGDTISTSFIVTHITEAVNGYSRYNFIK